MEEANGPTTCLVVADQHLKEMGMGQESAWGMGRWRLQQRAALAHAPIPDMTYQWSVKRTFVNRLSMSKEHITFSKPVGHVSLMASVKRERIFDDGPGDRLERWLQ